MFEFDPEKSKVNEEKHGINFYAARQLWQDPRRIIIPARLMDEERYILIASIDEITWSAVYTLREDQIRIISVRRARHDEKEIYLSSGI